MSLTLRALNEDSDAEFLANPRIVTADNQQAKIEITRNQPVPQLNFNEQTATAVFGGFEDKKFGNTLIVRPSVNKDDFITLSVKPEISNKVGDSTFIFAGAHGVEPDHRHTHPGFQRLDSRAATLSRLVDYCRMKSTRRGTRCPLWGTSRSSATSSRSI